MYTVNMESGEGASPEINCSTDLSDDDEETKHFQEILDSFKYYRTYSLKRLMLAEKHYSGIPAHHQALVPHFRDNLKQIHCCIEHNYEILQLIIKDADTMFENKSHSAEPTGEKITKPPGGMNMDKLRTTLKQIVRDWSSEGLAERDACYRPVINQILKHFPPTECIPEDVEVLVPGAGLGRLAFEIARNGYTCQGNEFSLFMLLVSNFILNKCQEEDMFTMYPWVHQYCNLMSSADQIKPVTFPDINPAKMPPGVKFSMAAGDFLEVYTKADSWDCVATVFFIDTAHNVIQYIETIHKILKPGGIWINMGPLLYHFADMARESSIELSYEDLRSVILKFNFEILEEQTNVPACYTQNPRSMLNYEYRCVFMVLRKSAEILR